MIRQWNSPIIYIAVGVHRFGSLSSNHTGYLGNTP